MTDYQVESGPNNIVIPTTETVANILGPGTGSYGIITVASNRTTPLTMNINGLTFGGVAIGKPACIDFGDNNLLNNELYFWGKNTIINSSIVGGGGERKSAIRVANGTTLTIFSDSNQAKLNCTGSNAGAGIGGGYYGDATNVGVVGAINIEAAGGDYGAGIGGGNYGCSKLVIVVGWGIVSAKNGGGVAPNAPQDIGKGGNCPEGGMNVVLSNPNFENVNNPNLVKIKVLLNGEPYADEYITLIIGENSALRLDTKTDDDGNAYFYATEGTYAFTVTEGTCTLGENYFTVPPIGNVPVELVFDCGVKRSRGINLFIIKKR